MTNNLRQKIEPLLAEFKRANGRGNLMTTNNCLINMIEMLISHIEQQNSTGFLYNYAAAPYAAAAPNGVGTWQELKTTVDPTFYGAVNKNAQWEVIKQATKSPENPLVEVEKETQTKKSTRGMQFKSKAGKGPLHLDTTKMREIFNYEPDTGFLTWKERVGNASWNTKYAGKEVGYINKNGLRRVIFEHKDYAVHRICYALAYDTDPGETDIEHINSIKNDNRKDNLKLGSRRLKMVAAAL